MTKLSMFKSDTKAIQDGAWVLVNKALYGDLEIQARGFTDEYFDAQTQRLTQAAASYGGDVANIPNADRRDINAALMRDFVIIGVRGLENEDGSPVQLPQFHDMLGDPAYSRLLRLCGEAAARVNNKSVAATTAAVGNSEPGSAGG